VANFFLCQLIGIDENNTFQLNFYSSIKIVGANCRAWRIACAAQESQVRSQRSYGQTDRRTWLDRLG